MGEMPSDCDTSDAGGNGGYVVRHNPFVYFPQGRTGPACESDVSATGLLTALSRAAPPDFVFYSPSICEDGGNDAPCSTIANGDRFLAGTVPAIMATNWYRDRGTIILTWDEGASSDTSGMYGDAGGHILTVVISARTRGEAADSGYVDSAGILHTIEQAYGLSYLSDAANPDSGTLPLGKNLRDLRLRVAEPAAGVAPFDFALTICARSPAYTPGTRTGRVVRCHHRGHPTPLAILPALRRCLRFSDRTLTSPSASRPPTPPAWSAPCRSSPARANCGCSARHRAAGASGGAFPLRQPSQRPPVNSSTC
jgi:hypothetical protein